MPSSRASRTARPCLPRRSSRAAFSRASLQAFDLQCLVFEECTIFPQPAHSTSIGGGLFKGMWSSGAFLPLRSFAHSLLLHTFPLTTLVGLWQFQHLPILKRKRESSKPANPQNEKERKRRENATSARPSSNFLSSNFHLCSPDQEWSLARDCSKERMEITERKKEEEGKGRERAEVSERAQLSRHFLRHCCATVKPNISFTTTTTTTTTTHTHTGHHLGHPLGCSHLKT